jgi:ectoine hydroxylase-related dioxygenase (phytanoyl-CoA dioxygenase family)
MEMQYDQSGFAITSAVLQQNACATVVACLDAQQRGRAGARHLLNHEAVQSVANDPRLLAIATSFIGTPAIPFKATLFDKSPHSNWLVTWHQDVALPIRSRVDASGWGPWSVKGGQLYAHAPAEVLEQVIALRLHLDDSTFENGPLRVLPGTHSLGRLPARRISDLAGEVPSVACTVPAGGVIAMRPLIIHASSKSRSSMPRRVLHIEYAPSLNLGSRIELAVA